MNHRKVSILQPRGQKTTLLSCGLTKPVNCSVGVSCSDGVIIIIIVFSYYVGFQNNNNGYYSPIENNWQLLKASY